MFWIKAASYYKDECVLALSDGKSLDDYEFISYSQELLNSDIKKHEYLLHWKKWMSEYGDAQSRRSTRICPGNTCSDKRAGEIFSPISLQGRRGVDSIFSWYGNKNHRVSF